MSPFRIVAAALRVIRGYLTISMFAVCLGFLSGQAGLAQEEDEDPPANPQVVQFEVDDRTFNSMVFRNFRDAGTARSHLVNALSRQVSDVDQVCQLDAAQRKKLELAGRGDILRYFDQVQGVHQKFQLVRRDQEKFNQLWRDINPLQTGLQAGLFGEKSLFRKTLKKTLTAQQLENYVRHDDERQQFRYRAKVELALATLEVALPLRDEQRQRLIKLLVERRVPLGQLERQSFQIVLWNLSQVPEHELKPLFDEIEWKVLSHQFAQVAAFGQMMKQNARQLDDADLEEP